MKFNGIGKERARNINLAIVYFILFFLFLNVPVNNDFSLETILSMLLVLGIAIFCLNKSLSRLYNALK